MKVVLFILVSFIHVAFTSNTPTFTLLDSRLDDDAPMPIPNILVTFPDGYSDNLVLNHFYSENDHADGCHFLGHLKNEQEACIAMTGCIGSEDVEFTMMSEHAPENGLFKWKLDGNVEVIDHPYKNGAADNRRDANDIRGDPAQMQAEAQIEKSLTTKSKTLPPNQKLKVKVFYDKSLKTKLGSDKAVKSFYDSAHVHLQASFCHVSLGTKIKLERLGEVSSYVHEKKLLATDQGMLEATDFTLKNIGKADLVIYLTDNDKKGFSGIAPEGTLCIPSSQQKSVCLESGLGCHFKPANAWKYSISEYLKSVASMGKLIAHEMGHNMGLQHDADEFGEYPPGGPCDKPSNIMMPSIHDSSLKWSTCSKKDFKAHYILVTETNPWCLEALSSDACAGITIPKTTTPKPPNPKCKSAGDNICDDEANIAECNYDGGDCCGEGKEKWACTICKCLDPKFEGK